MGKLVFGFVTSYAPRCISRLEEILFEFVRPPSQEAWLHALRTTPAYLEARERLISQLRLKLPVPVVRALDARFAVYDKSASHALKAQVDTLPASTQADYATLVMLLWVAHPSQPGSHRRTLVRTPWEKAGLERNLLQLKVACPNCHAGQADLEIAEGQYLWELTCPSCGYGDRSASDMPHVPFGEKPELSDHTWSAWATGTSAAFAEWDLSAARRQTFLERLASFAENLEEQLSGDLVTLANEIRQTPPHQRSYSFATGACAVIYPRTRKAPGHNESVRIFDREADRLALAQQHRGELAFADEPCPYRHWEEQFSARLASLKDALRAADPIRACVAAGQLLTESQWFGFLLPLRLTLQLPEDESLPLSELVTHPEHLAVFLAENLGKGLRGRPTVAQLTELLRRYIQNGAGVDAAGSETSTSSQVSASVAPTAGN